ncbi:MerR family transcriptional regulator [Marinactinospora rubrisoli]|uniref:MerR family transcriptional regulator n=1 Tax=Marinactinospora rubrisoli TaxID=2715399 RepID=A0ABW2KFW6_9ACTN
MLSISDFSEMCLLSPQTLRFYHSEGLLVPAEVDEQTGYRSYTFDQVEQAALITALRGAGMSVKLVRRALDEPDTASALLHQHVSEVQRQRQAQDEAISDACELLRARPEPRLRHAPEMTVVSRLVPGSLVGQEPYDWDAADAVLTAAVRELVAAVRSSGATVSGTPWWAWAMETPEQKRKGLTAGGPDLLVNVPVADAAALPGDLEVRTFEARDELSIFIPGRTSMAKFATAISRLAEHPLGGAFIDVGRMRHVLHDDGVETAMAVRRLDEADESDGTDEVE